MEYWMHFKVCRQLQLICILPYPLHNCKGTDKPRQQLLSAYGFKPDMLSAKKDLLSRLKNNFLPFPVKIGFLPLLSSKHQLLSLLDRLP